MANKSPEQTIVDVLGTEGAMSGNDLKARTGLDINVLKTAVLGLIDQGIMTKDGSIFDVVEEYRVEGRDEVAEPVVEMDDFSQAAPTPAARPAAPAKKAAPAPAKKAAPAPTKAAPAKKAVAAPTKSAPAEAAEPKTLYYTDAMDTLTVEELNDRVRIGMEAAEANAALGGENVIVAEILERWVKRAERRLRSIAKGKSQIRTKGTAGDE